MTSSTLDGIRPAGTREHPEELGHSFIQLGRQECPYLCTAMRAVGQAGLPPHTAEEQVDSSSGAAIPD